MAIFVLLWYDFIAWIGYKLLTIFIKSLKKITEKSKWLRLFLPFTWFADRLDYTQVTVAGGGVMLVPYILLAIPVVALANYDVPELRELNFLVIVYSIISACYMFANVRINKRNFVDKF